MSNDDNRKHVVVVGGGIAGVTCAETLWSLSEGNLRISLISASKVLKVAVNTLQLSRTAELFEVQEGSASLLSSPAIDVLYAEATSIEVYDERKIARGRVGLKDGRYVEFDACCIATGARPTIPESLSAHFGDLVLTVRDTDSVARLKEKVADAKNVLVIGNGGIALELVHELEGCDILWAVKDNYIGHTFFDRRTSEVLSRLSRRHFNGSWKGSEVLQISSPNSMRSLGSLTGGGTPYGAGVGPNWVSPRARPRMLLNEGNADIHGKGQFQHSRIRGSKVERSPTLKVLHKCEVERAEIIAGDSSQKNRARVTFSNGFTTTVDVVIAATGVTPNVEWLSSSPIQLSADPKDGTVSGGILVDSTSLSTSCEKIYAAGDCTTVCITATTDEDRDWFQMRLWTQARAAGRVTARKIAADLLGDDAVAEGLELELFAHATKFFDTKIVLLGRYNAQGLKHGFRIIEGGGEANEESFIRVVLQDGRMRGAILIGETGLEETYENLILDKLQVGHLGSELVDPSVDLEDYFD